MLTFNQFQEAQDSLNYEPPNPNGTFKSSNTIDQIIRELDEFIKYVSGFTMTPQTQNQMDVAGDVKAKLRKLLDSMPGKKWHSVSGGSMRRAN